MATTFRGVFRCQWCGDTFTRNAGHHPEANGPTGQNWLLAAMHDRLFNQAIHTCHPSAPARSGVGLLIGVVECTDRDPSLG